jgi:hypothetical protein
MHREAPRDAVFGRLRSALVSLSALLALALIASSPASGAVTIGSDLAPDPDSAPCGVAACTLANLSHGGLQVASPIDGVVVRFRVRNDLTDVGGNTVRPRVIRPAAGGAFTGIATGASATVLDLDGGNPSTQVFPTSLPIMAGDLVALDSDAPHGNLAILRFTPGESSITRAYWEPPLANGSTLGPTVITSNSGDEYMFNADVEPDADCDGRGDETQDAVVSGGCAPAKPAGVAGATVKGKRLRLTLECALASGDCADNQISLRTAKKIDLGKIAATAKAKRILLARGSASLAAGETKTVALKLRKRGRRLFRARKKVRATATVTAAGGSSTETLRIRRK